MSILDERCMKRVTAGATVGAAVGGAVGVTCPACLAPCSSAHARRRLRRGCVRHIRGVSIPGACRRPRSAASTLGSGAPSLTGALSHALRLAGTSSQVPGLLKVRHIGKTTTSSAAIFGLFLAAGSLLQCGKRHR